MLGQNRPEGVVHRSDKGSPDTTPAFGQGVLGDRGKWQANLDRVGWRRLRQRHERELVYHARKRVHRERIQPTPPSFSPGSPQSYRLRARRGKGDQTSCKDRRSSRSHHSKYSFINWTRLKGEGQPKTVRQNGVTPVVTPTCDCPTASRNGRILGLRPVGSLPCKNATVHQSESHSSVGCPQNLKRSTGWSIVRTQTIVSIREPSPRVHPWHRYICRLDICYEASSGSYMQREKSLYPFFS